MPSWYLEKSFGGSVFIDSVKFLVSSVIRFLSVSLSQALFDPVPMLSAISAELLTFGGCLFSVFSLNMMRRILQPSMYGVITYSLRLPFRCLRLPQSGATIRRNSALLRMPGMHGSRPDVGEVSTYTCCNHPSAWRYRPMGAPIHRRIPQNNNETARRPLQREALDPLRLWEAAARLPKSALCRPATP